MLKRWFIFIMFALTLFSITACHEDSHNVTQETEGASSNSYTDTQPMGSTDKIDLDMQSTVVFDTENIKRITFYSYYGFGIGSDVPAENLNEIKAWLDSFKIDFDRELPDLVPPGTNTVHVEIEYFDGTIIKQGLEAITVQGVTYYLTGDPAPDCYRDILSRTSIT